MESIPSLLLLSLSVLSLSSPSVARDSLTPDTPLYVGQILVSAAGTFQLGFFSPSVNNSHLYVGVWYRKIPAQTVIWVANREKPLAGRNWKLSITENGTLVIEDGNSTSIVWSAAAYGAGIANPVAQLLDTGNFVIKEAGKGGSEVNFDSFAWQSFQHPTDTILPGVKFGWNRRTGYGNLTSWASADDPAPGEYTAFLDVQGYPQITLWKGSTKYYRTGPPSGFRLNDDTQLDMLVYDAQATANEVYFMYQTKNASDIIRIKLSPVGIAEEFVWLEQNKNWSRFWYQPKDQCDAASPCGPNGVCNLNELQICDCAPGYRPKDAASWPMQDSSEGCVRKTALDCRNATTTTDGFTTLPEMKMPDSESAVVDMSVTLEQCRVDCLSNCSCTAYASANMSSGIGCAMWMSELIGLRVYNQLGEELHVRLAAADLSSLSASKRPNKRRRRITIITVSLASCVISLALIMLLMRSMLRRKKGTSYSKKNKEGGDDVELPLFDLATILAAADNFSDNSMLGEGGFGIVYKGKLDDGQEIAVKRLSKTSLQGIDEFKNEVSLIAKLQHRNLVRLLGCCIEGDERLLVYEYMPCKSLDDNLFAKDHAVHLSWEARISIINGIARGLLYLHQDSRLRIIHRDLKASNILLDKDMNPKISDFGLARIFHDDIVNKTKRVVGTYGYMSPEYAMNGVFSVKSDVYSFGVLVLEIISGQKNRGAFLSEAHDYLLGYAWYLWNEGRSLELVDSTLGNNFVSAEVIRCIKVGLLCVQEFPEVRPKIPSVVMMLGSDNAICPEPKEPGFFARRGNNYKSQSFIFGRSEEAISVNDAAMSLTLSR